MTAEVGNLLKNDQSFSRVLKKAMKEVAEFRKIIKLKSSYIFIEVEIRNWQTSLKVSALSEVKEFKFDFKIKQNYYLVFDVMETMLIVDDEKEFKKID